MASLDRLASMEGWDISDEEEDDGPGTTLSDAAAAASRPQCIDKGGFDCPTSATIEPLGNVSLDGRSSTHGNPQPQRNDHHYYQQQHKQPNDLVQFSDDRTNDDRTPTAASSKGGVSPLARFGMMCRDRIEALNDPEQRSNERSRAWGEPSCQNSWGGALVLAAERSEPSTRANAWDLPRSASSQCITQSLDFVGREGLPESAGIAGSGDDAVGVDGAAVTKLRKLLRKEQEERARERRSRDYAEEQARAAYASLEAESKRALELENRVRVLNMRITLSSGHAGGAAEDAVKHAEGHPARARSASPVRRGRAEMRSGASAEVVETRAQMAVIAEATDTAREEAQSVLDAVEGFASLNRKLVGELRETICNRGDILEELDREREIREHLEGQVDDMLGGGLAAALKEKEDIMEARCEKERVETERVAALHKRMEEEYRLALKSLEQERDRLEKVVNNLDMQLQDELSAQFIRVKEERERATMGFEEICSIRAGFAPRTKRRSKLGRWGARTGTHEGESSGDGWLDVQRGRVEAQQRATGRVSDASRNKQPLRTLHNGARRSVAGSIGSSVAPQRKTKQYDRKVHAAGGSVTHGVVKGARPAINSSATKVGGSIVGTGCAGRGDGNAGAVVHAAAAESVEIFLGDFLPNVKQPALVAAAVKSGKDTDGGGAGGAGPLHKPASKWTVIGRAGKLSPRATAVFAEEATKAAEAEANARLRSIVNGSARLLSASWFSLIKRSTAVSASGYGSDSPPANTSVDATVSTIAVRRLVQTCGLLRRGAGGPSLAHVDMELQRNAVGRGQLGYREYFKVMLILTESRFTGESKNEALSKLSRMLREVLGEKGSTPPSPNRQNDTPATSRKKSSGSAAAAAKPAALAELAPTTSLEETGLDEGLAGAERVLERDRRALEAIFSHYAGDCASAASPSSGRGQLLLRFAALLSFCKDFELTPGLISRENAHLVYVQLAYPHETLLTPKMLASREGTQGRRVAGSGGTGGRDCTSGSSVVAAASAGLGLSLAQWMRWLGLTAVGCTWFDKQRGLYNTPTKKVLGLLQWMEGSVGKSRISSRRGAAVVPAFNLLPPEGAPRARR